MPLVSFYSCLWGLSELPGAELDERQGCQPKSSWHPNLKDRCWHEPQRRLWLTLASTNYIIHETGVAHNKAEVK